jgi:penicillin-binding protein 2
MPPNIEERRPAITPQLAVRVAVLGGLAFVLFAVVFFRLWFLQVLTGEDYVSQARENRVRKIKIEAPRGNIVDRNGQILVKTRVAPVVQITPESLPAAELAVAESYRAGRAAAERRRLASARELASLDERLHADGRRSTKPEKRERRRLRRAANRAAPVPVGRIPSGQPALRRLYVRLGRVIRMRPRAIHREVVEGIAEAPYSNVTIKTDVAKDAFSYLLEHREEFRGVVVEKRYLRDYPYRELGAQLFGTLREISPQELKERRYRGVAAGTRVGKDGIEETYDKYLRGVDGYTRVVINALGNRDDTRQATVRRPIQGDQLRLTLDLGLQRAANDAMKRAIAAANLHGNGAKAGAYVALDPRNGEVLALGSYPSFDANLFAKPLSQSRFDQLNSQANGAPLFNRAIAATYPTGSTFKPITAMAALESGIIDTGSIITDTGSFQLGNLLLQNARGASYGPLNVTQALKVSSDVFFYTLGERANPLAGEVIQTWARKLGLGRPTGIDIPGEPKGLVPDAEWRNTGYAAYQKCAKRNHVEERTSAALFACGGIERPWSTGDNVNLAIGQGDLQATPLQMAVAYSSIVNGGHVVRPHLGWKIEDGLGRQIEEVTKPPRRKVNFSSVDQQAILEGLRGAAMEDGGTSAAVMKGFPLTVYGKTGTVERPGQPDQSWYIAYVPHKTRPILVAVTIERGGFGAETAAPAARLILSEWFDVGDKQFVEGTSADR